MPNGRSDYFDVSKADFGGLLRSLMPDEVVGIIASRGRDEEGRPVAQSTAVAASGAIAMLEASPFDRVFVDEQDGDEEDRTFYILHFGPRLPSWIIVAHKSPFFALLRTHHRSLRERS